MTDFFNHEEHEEHEVNKKLIFVLFVFFVVKPIARTKGGSPDSPRQEQRYNLDQETTQKLTIDRSLQALPRL